MTTAQVADASLLLDYLASRPDVRKDALFLIGSSLGAPIVTIVGAIDTRPWAALYRVKEPTVIHRVRDSD